VVPQEWYKLTNCGYDAPEDPSVRAIVEQGVKGEQCAIDVYKRLLEVTRDKDEVTYRLILEILDDEVEHEADLQAILEDIDMMKKILVVAFVTSFIFAVTLAFCGKQWMIGVVSFVLTAAIRGAFMPGQIVIPLYSLVFQGARAENAWSCRVTGFSASVLHVLYGVILAPMIFWVAPAVAILSLVRGHALDFGSAIAICVVAFGLGGMLSADMGRRLGIRIGANPGACMR
jgi:hypothetical protein